MLVFVAEICANSPVLARNGASEVTHGICRPPVTSTTEQTIPVQKSAWGKCGAAAWQLATLIFPNAVSRVVFRSLARWLGSAIYSTEKAQVEVITNFNCR